MNQTITIVSGLPRSGTSMMMQMLAAGGMEVIVDNLRRPDEDNPHGYYEFENVKQIQKDASWLPMIQGKAVKMVSMLLYYLPSQYHYKVIFMRRKMNEILRSQRQMLIRTGRIEAEISDEEMGALFTKHLRHVTEWLTTQQNVEVLPMDYHEVLAQSLVMAEKVNDFLGKCLNVANMAGVVETALYRHRA